VLAATIESLVAADLARADLRDRDKPEQILSARRALRELRRVRVERIDAGGTIVELVTRRTPLQARILTALEVDTSGWSKAKIG
jgi:hypothetical protein